MCHDLAFDRVGGTLRTLRHGEPAQVVADLRDFYRGRAAPRPSVLGAGGAAAAGRCARPAQPHPVRPRPRTAPSGRSGRVFSPGGACFDCHRVEAPPAGSLDFRIRPVAFPIRYLHKGWFDHRAHATQSCSSCHAAERSNAASDLLIPDLASCRTCHGGEGSSKPVPSSCAMCHDYHMDAGAPSMLIRQRVRGKKRDTRRRGGAALMLIAQITDVHLGFEPGNPDELNRKRLDCALRTLAEMVPRPDLLLATGDLADTGDDFESYARLKEAVGGPALPGLSTRSATMTAATPSGPISPISPCRTASSNMRSRSMTCASSSSTRSRKAATAAISARPAPPG